MSSSRQSATSVPAPLAGARRRRTPLAVALALSAAALLWLAPAALAQVSFSGPTNFAAGTNPASVAVGDFNGDADPDLAVANTSSHNVSVLLGGAGGSFGAATDFAAGSGPYSIAVGDFNGDLDPDLAVANYFSDNVSVLLGGAGGSFGAATDFAAGTTPFSVAVGDFNGDLDPDLAVANNNSDNVSVLLGGAGGSFGTATDFAAGDAPASVAVGDFNGDLDPDLAVANGFSDNVSVLLGGAGGSFGAATDFAAGSGPYSVAVGDFNGDLDPDLAVANGYSDNVSVLLGGAGGSFGAATDFAAGTTPFSVAVGDFNGDLDPDLAVANINSDNVSVLLGGAGGSFGAATDFAAGAYPASVAVGDFDLDLDPDLAVANNGSRNVSVLLTRIEDDPGDGIIRPTLDPQAPPKDAAWGWGHNWLGVLGTGAPGDRRVLPGEIGGLPGVDALATGLSHSVGVEPSGRVWAWGYNGQGQLGDGTTSPRSTPVQVSGMTGVDAVAAGANHSLAVKSAGGTVRAWGYNPNGQLGDGTTSHRTTSVQPLGMTGVDAVAAGANHSLAVKSADGSVWAWGYNANGELGDGTISQRLAPVQVSGLTGIEAVGAGVSHSLAVKSADGSVWAWGYNANGQLGDNSISQRLAPVQVSGLTGVDAVAAGESHSVAVKSDGTVWAWGYNGYGQLGDGTTSQRRTPVQVMGLTGVTAVAAGQVHSVALKSDGTVWAWGYNGEGSLGDGTITYRYTPVQVKGLTDADAVAAGGRHSLAVGRASPTQGGESFTQALPAGATVTTDVEQDGATPDDPLETTLTTPVAGTVSIAETPSSPPVGGFSVYGRSVQITAPAASAGDPLVIRFRLDASIFLSHWPLSLLSVHRNGNTVGDCTGPGASPDPCVEGRTRLPDGDVEVVVRTSAASDWAIGRAGPAANAGGPYTVAEGSKTTLNGSSTGGETPFSYRWSGVAGELDDPSKARPTFTGLDDAQLTLNLLVTDAADLAGTDDTTVTVTNRPPVVSPLAVDENRSLRLKVGAAFADPGRLDTHTALVRWGDGTQSAARVSERHGIGAAVADHQYARKGTYTVRLTLRDDDGGERTVERRIEIR